MHLNCFAVWAYLPIMSGTTVFHSDIWRAKSASAIASCVGVCVCVCVCVCVHVHVYVIWRITKLGIHVHMQKLTVSMR